MTSASKQLQVSQHDANIAEIQGTTKGVLFRYREVLYDARQERIQNARMVANGICSFCGYVHSERPDLSQKYHAARGRPYEVE